MPNARLSTCSSRAAPSRRSASRRATTSSAPSAVVAFLLLERRLPRAVLLLPRAVRSSSIRAISGDALRPERAIGRVFAELAFTELHALGRDRPSSCSTACMRGIADAADEIAAGYFTTPRRPARPLRPAAAAAAMMPARRAHDRVRATTRPIAEAYTELRLRPLEGGGQHCSSFRLDTEPPGVRVREYRDHFGNAVHHFDVLESHDRLAVTARERGRGRRRRSSSDRVEPTPLELHDYLAPDRLRAVRRADPRARRRHGGGRRPSARELMEAVRARARLRARARPTSRRAPTRRSRSAAASARTSPTCCSPPAAASGSRPATSAATSTTRRSSATTRPRTPGSTSGTSERGWLSLDPTHDREQTDAYVRVAVGRDYADVPPTRGVYKGAANETLAVRVGLQSL